MVFSSNFIRLIDRKLSDKQVKNQITSASENPTIPKVTRISDERRRGTEEELKSLRNGKGTEKSDECKRGMQKKNGKERAAGDEKFEVHLY